MLYSQQITNETFTSLGVFGANMYSCSIEKEFHANNSMLFYNCKFDGTNSLGALKVSKSKGLIFNKCIFNSGEKSCIDIESSSCIDFIDCIFNLKRSFDINILLSSHSINFIKCRFVSKISKKITAFLLGTWNKKDLVPRPPVKKINFDKCIFNKNVKSYLCLFAVKPNIDGRVVSKFLINLIWTAVSLVIPKSKKVDYKMYKSEF